MRTRLYNKRVNIPSLPNELWQLISMFTSGNARFILKYVCKPFTWLNLPHLKYSDVLYLENNAVVVAISLTQPTTTSSPFSTRCAQFVQTTVPMWLITYVDSITHQSRTLRISAQLLGARCLRGSVESHICEEGRFVLFNTKDGVYASVQCIWFYIPVIMYHILRQYHGITHPRCWMRILHPALVLDTEQRLLFIDFISTGHFAISNGPLSRIQYILCLLLQLKRI